MARNLRAGRSLAGMVLLGWTFLFSAGIKGDTITLKNGMRLEGTPSTIASVKTDPLKGTGPTDVKPILIVDNQLTRTFVRAKEVVPNSLVAAAVGMERIPIFQRIPTSGSPISSVGALIRSPDPFDEYGHRIFAMMGPKGPIEVVQGITEITPKWTKVEAIEGIHHYIWTTRIATSSIPREQLSKILNRAMDAKSADARIRIVRLYMQSERFADAREELRQVIKDFPGLEHLNDTVKELNQLNAQRLFKEIELRRDAGQYALTSAMLENFPTDGISGEMLLKAREMLDEMQTQQQQGTKVLKLIDENVARMKSDTVKKQTERIIAEIKKELNMNNLDRFADFLRLADDNNMAAEQKLSLAISGWLLGSGAAVDSLDVSLALVAARNIVRQYMNMTRKSDRDNLMEQLPSEVTIDHVAKIVAHMKPPIETTVVPPAGADLGNPAELLGLPADAKSRNEAKPEAGEKAGNSEKPAKEDDSGSCAPKDKADDSALLKGAPKAIVPETKAEPPVPLEAKPAEAATATAEATDIPGLYKMSVTTNVAEQPVVHYWVQTPPEYDPYRRYPCILTLNGASKTPLNQLAWWAGDYKPKLGMRDGQATRHGYIVIAPVWTREHQRQYEYSAREHTAVLSPLADACKRFSIDVDRVFLTGHSMGGTAAWDVGLAHPDLWAGVMPMVATPGRYITQYWENGKYLPMYFVCGEKDRGKWDSAGDWDKYLTKLGYDATVVEYLGRGHEDFSDEIQNMFAWMRLHKRNFFPKEFRVQSLRPWDNFFWWVETDEPLEVSTILPAEWGELANPAKMPRAAETKASPIAPNGVRVASGSCGKVRVWLSPEIVAFNNTLKVIINDKPQKNVQPRIGTLLEDVRTRGDRQHPFWAKVVWPPGEN